MVDFPLSPEPFRAPRQLCRPRRRTLSGLPRRRILHSLLNFLASSSKVRSIAWLLFFCSSSSLLVLMHVPMISDTAGCTGGPRELGRLVQTAAAISDTQLCGAGSIVVVAWTMKPEFPQRILSPWVARVIIDVVSSPSTWETKLTRPELPELACEADQKQLPFWSKLARVGGGFTVLVFTARLGSGRRRNYTDQTC